MGSLKHQVIAEVSLDEATLLKMLVRMLRRFSGQDRKNLLEALEGGVFDLTRTVTSEILSHGLKGKASGSALSRIHRDRVRSLVREYVCRIYLNGSSSAPVILVIGGFSSGD